MHIVNGAAVEVFLKYAAPFYFMSLFNVITHFQD